MKAYYSIPVQGSGFDSRQSSSIFSLLSGLDGARLVQFQNVEELGKN